MNFFVQAPPKYIVAEVFYIFEIFEPRSESAPFQAWSRPGEPCFYAVIPATMRAAFLLLIYTLIVILVGPVLLVYWVLGLREPLMDIGRWAMRVRDGKTFFCLEKGMRILTTVMY